MSTHRPLRILHLIASIDPAHGGPIEGIKQLGSVSCRAGHKVEVASLDAPEATFTKEFPLPLHTFGPSHFHYGYNSNLVPWLRRNHSTYDAVVVNGLWQYNSFAAWRALRWTTTPYFVFPHGMLDPWFKKAYPTKHLKKWFYWAWGQYPVLRDARAVLFTCEEERRLAQKSFRLYKCTEITVHYGTSSPPGVPDQQRETFFKRFPDLRDHRLITFLGRIHPKKGCDLLLKAFARVRAESNGVDNARVVLAGPDNNGCGAALRSLSAQLGLKDLVTWAGMVQGDLKWGLLHASEVFILPSHQENFGIAVAEALACQLPALISNKVNIWREIIQDRAGFAADDSVEGTTDLLRNWLRLSPAQRNQARLNARRCFNDRFEIQKAAFSLLQAISSSRRSN